MTTIEELKKQREALDARIAEAYKLKEAEGEAHFKDALPILKPYIYFYDFEKKDDFNENDYHVKGVPPEVMQKLIDAKLMDASMLAANSKFTMAKLIKLGKEHNGVGGGTARPNDIYFDEMVFNIPEEEAKKLKRNLRPDEFDKQGEGWRFWWD